MGNVSKLDLKPDRLASQMELHREMSEELWATVQKYQEAGLMDPLIRSIFSDIHFELHMGPAVFIEEDPT